MRLKAMAGLAALVAAGVAVARRGAVREAVRSRWQDVRPGGEASAAEPAREPWSCACGKRYLVAGRDRHRIYWLEGAPESDPLLSDRCPECERPLPAEHEAATVTQA
jgi:hypothetical protein